MNRLLKLNGFWLKIIAYFFMTIDHLGKILYVFAGKMPDSSLAFQLGDIFSKIGRITFPLIVFLIVEGVIHTKNFWKYLLRIGIIALAIMIFQILAFYLYDSSISSFSSPFIDLVFIALTIYFINRKDKLSWLAILPAAYIILCFVVDVYSRNNLNVTIHWLPFYLRCDYSLIGLLLGVGFYFAKKLSEKYIYVDDKTEDNSDSKMYQQTISNMLSMGVIVIVTLLVFFSGIIKNGNIAPLDIYQSSIQTWMITAFLPILFYNGKRGYNAKWFQYGSYLYFPVHIIILFGIFYLIFGL